MKVACCPDGSEGEIAVWDGPAAFQAWLHRSSPAVDDAVAVAWWVSPTREPSPAEAVVRRDFLREHGSSPYAFSPSQLRDPLTIERVSLDDTEVQLLIAQLNAELLQRYPEPGALVFSLHPRDVVEGRGALLMAERNGRPVGCGAFHVLDDLPSTAEVKRMFVVPSARGQKIGAAILCELEARCRSLGVRRLVLELGPRQPEAIRRYERAGFSRCEPWGEFADGDLSICMAKALDG